MSRLYKINKKYNKYKSLLQGFVLAVLTRKFIRNGGYFRAKRLIIKTFEIIKLKEPYNVYLIFLIALYNISPRIKFTTEINPVTKKLKKKKKLLTKFDSFLQGINMLVENYAKNKGKSICSKLANEIIFSFYKKSFSYNKKMELEREIVKSTAKMFDNKKRIKFFVIK
jgi:ribosomal protein S7